MSFENGKLKIQDVELTIPDGFEENESAQKLAEDANDVENAKYSLCQFVKDGQEIVVKVFFFDNGNEFTNLTPASGEVEKNIAGVDGLYNPDKFGDNTPTFRYVKDGKVVEINAPNDDIISSIIKS